MKSLLYRLLWEVLFISKNEYIWRFIQKSLNQKNVSHSFFVFSKNKAEHGNAFALYALAYCFDKGCGVVESDKSAFAYAQKAFHCNEKYGANLLGVFYEYGFGTSISYRKAFWCYWISAKLGSSYGAASLSRCYRQGIGTSVNLSKCHYWLSRALKKKNPYALNQKGWELINTSQNIKDVERAVSYFLESAKSGNYYGLQSLEYVLKNNILVSYRQKVKAERILVRKLDKNWNIND